jgi:hypothetical protein
VYPLAALVVVSSLLAGSASADTLNWATPSGFQVSIRSEEIRGNSWQIQRAYVTVGTNKLAFVVPEGFRADASDPQRIVISDVNCTCFITFRFVDLEPAASKELQPDSYRDLALGRFPDARITNEYTDFVGNRSGPGFDLRWKNWGGTEQCARVAYIPSAAGVMEFSLVSSSARFEGCQTLLRTLMSSLRNNEDGPLKITPITDIS